MEPSGIGNLQSRPASNRSRMVLKTVARPTPGTSFRTDSAVNPSSNISIVLEMRRRADVRRYPPSSIAARRSGLTTTDDAKDLVPCLSCQQSILIHDIVKHGCSQPVSKRDITGNRRRIIEPTNRQKSMTLSIDHPSVQGTQC